MRRKDREVTRHGDLLGMIARFKVRSVCVLRLKVEAISAKLHACPEPPPSR